MKKQKSPYLLHVFVCTNSRDGKRKSCGDSQSSEYKNNLKKFVNDCGLKGKVRISTTGCLGLCNTGPNIIIYPQGVWFSDVALDDMEIIQNEIKYLIENLP